MQKPIKLFKKYFKHWPTLAVILMGLTPVIWFVLYGRGGKIINGVDTNFPLNPVNWFLLRFFVWNPVGNAGLDFSSSTAGLFFHFIQVIPSVLGLGLQNTQIFSLVFWFLLIVFCSFWFAKIILPKKPLIQILFVSLYAFNIYLFNTWENVKVANLALVAAIPLAVSTLILLWDGRISKVKAAFLSALTGIVLSGSGINPSYFICFFLVVFFFLFGKLISDLRVKNIGKVIGNTAFLLVFTVLVNLFWILPSLKFIFANISPQGSISELGFTNWVDSLSENTSLLNIIRLQGAWDWYSFDSLTGLPLYIPYALNYFRRMPFLVFSFLLPTLALLALVVRRRKTHLYIGATLMFTVGVFLGVGTHEPTGVVFRYLYEHLPFFSLFRSPWYIFTPLVVLAQAILVGLFFSELSERFTKPLYRKVIAIGVAVLIVGNLIYNYPLVTGKIFRPHERDGFFVRFPGYVYETGDWLKGKDFQGRIAGYPDDEIEQFDWGYRGIESILQLTGSPEMIFSSLNVQNVPLSTVVKSLYLSLKKNQLESFYSLASKLNLEYLFEKGDQRSLSAPLPKELKNQLAVAEIGPWHFYKLPSERILPKIFFANRLNYLASTQESTALSVLDNYSLLVGPNDSIVKSVDGTESVFGQVVVAKNTLAKDFFDFSNSPSLLANRLISRDLTRAVFEFELTEDGLYQPVLERYKLEDFGIIPDAFLSVEVDGQTRTLFPERISDSHVYYSQQEFNKGSHQLSFPISDRNLVTGGDFEGEKSFDEGGYGEGKVVYQIDRDEFGNYLMLYNLDRAEQSANFTVNGFEPFSPYYVELRYKQIYGNNALVVADQNTENTLVKAQSERLPNYPEWRNFSFYFEPVQTDSKMRISLIAPYTKDVLGTKILYDDLSVKKVFTNNLVFVKEGDAKLATPQLRFDKSSPVLYRGEITRAFGPHVLIFLENYSPDWELKLSKKDGSPLNIETKHFSSNLYANSWYIEGAPEEYQFKIYYKPQRLFNTGLIISVLTILVTSALALRKKRNK